MQTIFDARPPTRFLFEAFDDFVRVGMPACVEGLPPIDVGGHGVTLRNLRLHPPAHAEPDGDLTATSPDDCHARELTYHGILRGDVYDRDVLVAGNELVGYLPIMVGSLYDVGRERRPRPPADHGAYFVTRGQRRYLISQEVSCAYLFRLLTQTRSSAPTRPSSCTTRSAAGTATSPPTTPPPG